MSGGRNASVASCGLAAKRVVAAATGGYSGETASAAHRGSAAAPLPRRPGAPATLPASSPKLDGSTADCSKRTALGAIAPGVLSAHAARRAAVREAPLGGSLSMAGRGSSASLAEGAGGLRALASLVLASLALAALVFASAAASSRGVGGEGAAEVAVAASGFGRRAGVADVGAHLEAARRRAAVKVLDGALFPQMVAAAKATPRKRKIFDWTPDPTADVLQRFVNVWTRGSYAPPHKHTFPEAFVVVSGTLAFWTFDEGGRVLECRVLGPGGSGGRRALLGIDVKAGVWHTMSAYGPSAVVWETNAQPGGYGGPARAKHFAPWAPGEDRPAEAQNYLRKLMRTCKRYRKPGAGGPATFAGEPVVAGPEDAV